ncbi:hemolysin-type calcium-binding region [Ectocarpus siliculosus]|uniref:Hemolysin-type calcium-binding region n=1 Tax=Ectocarpus siliculosus TaxID=2880 RepID=D8LS43_ECTSI|nr:hemolysin-type calcium-binding region [Ectocarpus siliculosus]|eukprot:CBN75100.1 hemolysin-type calcium-binding region [Ectocarpus siliculosus]
MGGHWRWLLACEWFIFLAARGLASPLDSLEREHWVSLDSTATDQTTDVATGAGGMVYISGYQQQAAAGTDGSQPSVQALLMAYNSSGVRQWVAEYGSSGEDLGNSVAADSTGVYLAGTESVPRSSSNGSSSSGATTTDDDDTDAFVVKYNSTGGVLWKTSWGSSEPDLGNGLAVDGGSGLVYIVGTTRGSMYSDGTPEGGGGGDAAGGVATGSSEATAAEEDDASAATAGANAGMSDVFLTCLDAADGEMQWTRQFGSSAVDVGNRVAVGPRGGVFLVGQLGDDADSSLAGPRAFLAKYDYLGNAQFTARLNSTSAHYAVDLAPSIGSGGEGVVYMSGYTLGDSPSVFLARFEGSTGAQTWLSHLGEETGMPHLAQSVAVVEGSQYDFSLGVGGAAEGAAAAAPGPSGDAGEGEEQAAVGNEARIVVVGYNTSAAAADSHSSTGFTAAADTSGSWAWYSASEKADRQTAIAIGTADGVSSGSSGGGSGGGESFAYIVGTVAASEASPGNYLFLDIQRVVRERSQTPAPTAQQAAAGQGAAAGSAADPPGGASSTTGLSQGSSLWLLIIAPIFVVLSCILMVGYVSKQCAIAFGTRPHPPPESLEPIDFEEDGGGMRTTRSFRRGKKSPPPEWNDRASGSLSKGSAGLRRSGTSSKTGRAAGWPRSVAAAFREGGSPYRKLRTREQEPGRSGGGGGGGGGRERREKRGSSASSSPLSPENAEVEMRQVTAERRHRAPFDHPREEEGFPGGGEESVATFEDLSHSKSGGATAGAGAAASAGWDAFGEEEIAGGGGGYGGRSHMSMSNPRDGDEPAADQPSFPLPAQGSQQLL